MRNTKKWTVAMMAGALSILTAVSPITAAGRLTQIETGNSRSTAAKISFGKTYSGSFDAGQEVDYYLFHTKDSEGYYTVQLINESTTGSVSFSVMEGKTPVCSATTRKTAQGDAASIDAKLDTDRTHYLAIKNDANVTEDDKYSFSISFRKDAEGDTEAEAIALQEGKLRQGTIDGTGDKDWFSFTPSASGQYEISLSGASGVSGSTYRLDKDDMPPLGKLSRTSGKMMSLTAGKTYLFEIAGNNNALVKSYNLQVSRQYGVSAISLSSVEKQELKTGKSLTVPVKQVVPASASSSIIWVSSNPQVATVDKNGKVTAKSCGTATITVKAKASPGVSASYQVSVIPREPVILDTFASPDKSNLISWKATEDAGRFEIYRSTSRDGKYTKIKTVSAQKLSYTDKTAKSGKIYYYYIVAIRKTGGITYRSDDSPITVIMTR